MKLPTLSRLVDWGLFAALAGLALVLVSRKMSGPDEGAPAAQFDLPVVGEPTRARFRLEDHHGQPVLVEVLASWCGACERSAPTLINAWRKHRASGVAFVAVSLDHSIEAAGRMKREWGIPYAVALDDGKMSASYGIEVLPTVLLIGADGRVRHVTTGSPSEDELDRWLTEL